jgi:hypothetical protein
MLYLSIGREDKTGPMGKRGKGYGSEDHLLRYHSEQPDALNSALLAGVKLDKPLDWIYPGKARNEPKDLDFIQLSEARIADWKRFWPSPGNRRWDAVARCGSEWILIEAKANEGELCSPPCGAKEPRLSTIVRALEETKSYMGVAAAIPWHQKYYQYANRIAALYFMNVIAAIPTRLVFLYFTGDLFPDGRRCPKDQRDWDIAINHCHQRLGLPKSHKLSDRMHDIFMPSLR